MPMNAPGGVLRAAVCAAVLAVVASAPVRPALAASNFPDIPVWVNPGTWQDSSLVNTFRCVGSFRAPLAESLKVGARAITVRFLRDRTAELRPDFGGYRLYRMTNSPDSAAATLIRRFSLNPGSELTWNFSRASRSSRISILPGNGDGTFGARLDVSSGVSPVSIAGANFNKDGRLDLATANEGSSSVTQFLGIAGGGVLQTGSQGARGIPAGLATADLDADTVSDVIVASRDQNLVTLLLSGTMSDTSYATGNQPSAIAAGDLNADPLPDVVVANEGSATVSAFLGLSRGRLGPRMDFPTQLAPSAVAIGRLNADTQGDLVVANRGSNSVSVFLGLGGGLLFGPRNDLTVGSAPAGVAIQDVSGDGFADIVVANSGDATVSVLLGRGDGTFQPATTYPTGLAPRAVAIGDLNGDGKPDLAVANEGAASVSVLLGTGTGGFGAKSDFATGPNPSSLVIGELTGDTKPDLAVANRSYTAPFLCNSAVVNDSIVTFVDPDSNGQYQKVCRQRTPAGVCLRQGDSVFVLVAPPGPHDGFLTWYSVTIEKRNTTDPDYEDLFLPDTLNNFARCTDPLDRKTCPNLNHKLRNLAGPVEPTSGPAPNLERVLAVPNPYRGHETWDQPGQREVHFINLPSLSKIRIYTIAGDLVRELHHNDKVRDFERWDLKNDSGKLVASGIYIYRVESATFHFQNRLVVIL